jgi:catechol 2,3-dioxygenase-like lactoylglutathione lyase family enzyme
MSRVQLALNVDDLDDAVDFYTKLFNTQPAKQRQGYANFVIAEPPLKLVLIAGEGRSGTLNHLGIEVESTEQVAAATRRLAAEGLDTTVEDGVACCYALQDKVWVHDPSGAPWEVYTVLAEAPEATLGSATDCCGTGAGATETSGTTTQLSQSSACC